MLRRTSLLLIILASVFTSTLLASDLPPSQTNGAGLKTKRQHASYAIGLNFGNNVRADGLKLDIPALVLGVQDGLAGNNPQLSEQQMSVAIRALQQEIQTLQQQRMQTEGAENARAGQAFLAANAKAPGVQTLPSGLQYKVITPGDGPTPTADDTVRTHYHGTLIDGTVFDSSVERGEPAVFPVKGVIKGWTEVLQRMKVGDKWMLYIPPQLAYGERGAGQDIGPNTTLIFEIELLGIE